MNTKLYYAFIKELNDAENEIRIARQEKNKEKELIAITRAKTWNNAINLLYIKGD